MDSAANVCRCESKDTATVISTCISNLTPWLDSASELYRPSDRLLSATLVPTFAGRGVSHGQCGGSLTAVISVA
jgi:hypothetical protein